MAVELRVGRLGGARISATRRDRVLVLALLGAVALGTALALAASTVLVPGDVGGIPSFSRRITSAFPGIPFVTCEVGHFEDTSTPQLWYVRPASAGELRVDVHALPASPSEGGALTSRLLDARGALLADASIPYLSATPNVVTLRAAVSAAAVYRLEVRRVPPTAGGEAHHYRLGLSGAPAEVGVASPALPHWLEGRNLAPQVFHVHVDAGEPLRLHLVAGEGQPIPFMTVELRDERGDLLRRVTSSNWDPFDVVLEPGGARTLRVVTSGNHHFTLEKRSGFDRGIYFDTCPPEAPRR